jgi:hypothetical protein
MLGRALKVAIALTVCVIACDLVGVAACFFFDVMPLRESSAALPYAIWFVLGVFCGLFSYIGAGGWMSPGQRNWIDDPRATATGGFIIAVTSVCLAASCVVCYRLWWRGDWLGDSYVPDSGALTLTFFGAILGSMLLLRATFKPG